MGIINVTPDSFSGDGLGCDVEAAVEQAKRMAAEGADIIDVGGESTRPGAPEVSTAEEISRVVPVIERLKAEIDLPISIDSYKAEVAEAAVKAGASLLNDVWGLKRDLKLAQVAARYKLPIILTSSQRDAPVENLIPAVLDSLHWAIDRAVEAGIPPENIIVDPGFGFGKTVAQNLEVLRRLGELRILGKPILLGTSRKSTIGKVLGDVPAADRLFGTVATTAIGIMNGADIIRVHDVKENAQAARMVDAVIRGSMPETRAITVYLGLGSNLGDREQNLDRAIDLIGQRLKVLRRSPVYETEPFGVPDQPKFLNMVIEAQSNLPVVRLLPFLKDIEQQLGRDTADSVAPRPIDLDILFYGQSTWVSKMLTIPHPRLPLRAFVLVPLNDLAPELKHPVTGKTVAEMLSALDTTAGVEKYRVDDRPRKTR